MTDFVRLTNAGNGLCLLQLFSIFFVLPEMFAEVGLNQSGSDGVASNTSWSEFPGPAACDKDNTDRLL